MCGATTTSGMMINGVYLVFEVTLCLTNRGTDNTRIYYLLIIGILSDQNYVAALWSGGGFLMKRLFLSAPGGLRLKPSHEFVSCLLSRGSLRRCY